MGFNRVAYANSLESEPRRLTGSISKFGDWIWQDWWNEISDKTIGINWEKANCIVKWGSKYKIHAKYRLSDIQAQADQVSSTEPSEAQVNTNCQLVWFAHNRPWQGQKGGLHPTGQFTLFPGPCRTVGTLSSLGTANTTVPSGTLAQGVGSEWASGFWPAAHQMKKITSIQVMM